MSPHAYVEHETEAIHLDSLSYGPNPLKGIPKYRSYEEHRGQILIHMAAAFRNWARCGFVEGISGHISVRDPEYPEIMWMNPIGKHFCLLNARDMVGVHIRTGKLVGGDTKSRPLNYPGYHIHSAIHNARPDVHSICHAHTIAGRAWSCFNRPLEMITQDVCNFYGVLGLMDEYGGIVTAEEEGDRIARCLGDRNKGAILMNHGLITVGSTVDEASFLFGLLERSCEIQLRVEAACAGNPTLKRNIISDELAQYNFEVASEKNWLYEEAQPDLVREIVEAGNDISDGLAGLSLNPKDWS